MSPSVEPRPRSPRGATIGEVAALAGAAVGAGALEARVSGVTQSAQTAQPGDLFVALPGAKTHGAKYAPLAKARGAVAVLTDAAGAALLEDVGEIAVLTAATPRSSLGALSALVYGDPSARLTVVGVTGTAGKTTTTYLLESLFQAAGRMTGVIGTVETRIGSTSLASSFTTPEAPATQALLAVMAEAGVGAVLMEVSSHALDFGRVDGTRFAAAGFTNLSQDHLDHHGDMESYFQAKAKLFEPGSPVAAGRAVVCVDDAWGERMSQVAREGAGRGAQAPVTVATSGARADWTVLDRQEDDHGAQEVVVRDPRGQKLRFRLNLLGRHNAANALLALGLAEAAGLEVGPELLRGWASISVPGRLERVDAGQDFLAVVDYAHKPEALVKVLHALREHTEGRIAVVVGAGGDRDQGKRPIMGEACALGAELVVVTDDNPRTEDPAVIRAQVLAGAQESGRAEVWEVGDRAEAIARAVGWARAGDTVLVAGKGHETYQEINGVKQPFDDREVLVQAIAAAGKGRERA
ncbi:UDP-N-acetylmuramoyl-L-alanyl-D-glutamate--2,6-diaminopimelate ligase [Segniliparus rugosus]|uniref:UDP-N-acetylmuramoyl-L-alanyl-D-glutamate--2,6-diaminopimelate ligase n=1 Tax=Segniliparus rugosus (strain ATCC BAA-974 / DSM 45345 / CCUG 50838 / CIP 108380 / JCM 13579 / CDC 945) TaxID=679197 RepID=E5XTP7_SEGRC|nr:UDP-N-acetylmuramoyl-L-alanyl-D-glutamate--2,6-diaminopimelate ligase [Segniliparus rugosus]EFV12250.1 UDP-N-acetylmuramyl-tripeptide synthetase [Segniliparus rugosus ATCC BAA-974]